MFDYGVFGFVLVALFILMMLGYFTRFFGKYFSGRLRPVLYVIWAGVILYILFDAILNPFPHRMTNGIRKALAKNDLASIVAGLKAYHHEYGSLPTGGNAQITKVLRGRNPKGIAFIAVPPRSINVQKEFVDPWQHPYRIGTSDPEFPWAYSFGQDGKDDGGAPGSDDLTSW